MGDQKHEYTRPFDAINHPPIAHPEAQEAGEFTCQSFDLRVLPWASLELLKASCELPCNDRVGMRIEVASFRREDDLKHRDGPSASQLLFRRRLPSRPG